MSYSVVYSLFFSVFLLFLSAADGFNITKILAPYPDFTTFNNLLTKTGVADEINKQGTLTVLAVANSNMGAVSGLSQEELKKTMAVHAVLDYYNLNKLHQILRVDGGVQPVTITSLYQTTGLAQNQQGFVNVTFIRKGEIAFGSASPGSDLSSVYVKTIHEEPYNIVVLHVSDVIGFNGVVPITPPSPPKPAAPSKSLEKAPAPAKAPVASPPRKVLAPASGPMKSPTPAASPKPSPTPAGEPGLPAKPNPSNAPAGSPGSPDMPNPTNGAAPAGSPAKPDPSNGNAPAPTGSQPNPNPSNGTVAAPAGSPGLPAKPNPSNNGTAPAGSPPPKANPSNNATAPASVEAESPSDSEAPADAILPPPSTTISPVANAPDSAGSDTKKSAAESLTSGNHLVSSILVFLTWAWFLLATNV